MNFNDKEKAQPKSRCRECVCGVCVCEERKQRKSKFKRHLNFDFMDM